MEIKDFNIRLSPPIKYTYKKTGSKTSVSIDGIQYFTFSHESKPYGVTQKFGVNDAPFYKQWGLKGHNGIDFIAPDGANCYAEYDLTVEECGVYPGDTAIYIKFVSDEIEVNGKQYRLVNYWFHLKDFIVKVGDRVKKGQLCARADNTGKFTTGSHLHTGWYVEEFNGNWFRDRNNGFNGASDQMSLYDLPSIIDMDLLNKLKKRSKYFFRPEASGEAYKIYDEEIKYLNAVRCDLFTEMTKDGTLTPVSEKDFNSLKGLIR